MMSADRSKRRQKGGTVDIGRRPAMIPGQATAVSVGRHHPAAEGRCSIVTCKQNKRRRRTRLARRDNVTVGEVVYRALQPPPGFYGNNHHENQLQRPVAALVHENIRLPLNVNTRRSFLWEIKNVFVHQVGNQQLLVLITAYNYFSEKFAEIPKIIMRDQLYRGDMPWKALENEIMRLATFRRCPDNVCQLALLLAQDGFAYNGSGREADDTVICRFCRVGKRNWKPTDDVSAVHKGLSPQCPMVTERSRSNVPFETEISSQRPHSILYGPFSKRIESFKTWPINSPVNPETLAANGFYYNGVDDTVYCFICGVGLSQWKEQDDVRVEHAKHIPTCSYIRDMMGPIFIEVVTELKRTYDQVTMEMVLKELPHQESTRIVGWLFSEANTCHYHVDVSFARGVRPCRSGLCVEGPDGPRYPRYGSSDVRQKTLKVATKRNIAIANTGFFYQRQSRQNVCYHCGVRQDFNLGDDSLDIVAEHARSSPCCGHLRTMLGDAVISVLQEKNFKTLLPYLKDDGNILRQIMTFDALYETVTEDFVDNIIAGSQCSFCNGAPVVVHLPCCGTVSCDACLTHGNTCACGQPTSHRYYI